MGVSNSSYYEQEEVYMESLCDLLDDLEPNTYSMLATIGYIIRPVFPAFLRYDYSKPKMKELVYEVFRVSLKEHYGITSYEELLEDMDKHLKDKRIDPENIFKDCIAYVTMLKGKLGIVM